MADSLDPGWQDAEPAMVGLHELAPHPANVRETLTDLDELAGSIARQGLVEPLEVMPAEKVASAWPEHADALAGYPWVLLSGHRRLAAARRVFADDPHTRVPALIRRDAICGDRDRQVQVMVTEAVASRALSPIEQARAFDAAVRGLGRSQSDIAELYGCTQAHVSQQLSLLQLPDELQQAVDNHELTVRDGLRLARLDGHEQMRSAWKMVRNRREYAWVTTVEQAIAEHTARAQYQARREAALSCANREGVRVVDPVEEFGGQMVAHRLTGREQVEAARAAGTLVAGVSGTGDLEYYTTAPVPEPADGPDHPDTNQRRAAAAARERAATVLAAQPPPALPVAAEQVVDAFVRSADDRWRPMARRWLERLQVLPTSDVGPAAWWEQIYKASWETRTWAAHCLALARSEHQARTHDQWDEDDIAWLRQLVNNAGYLPRPWDRRRLAGAASEAEEGMDVSRLSPEAPPD